MRCSPASLPDRGGKVARGSPPGVDWIGLVQARSGARMLPMSEVEDRTGLRDLLAFGRGRVLLFCWLGWMFDFHDLILFSFTKRSIGAELGLDAMDLAWIEGLGLLSSAVGGLLFGRMADLCGRRRAMTWSILVYSLGALLTGLSDGFGSLLVARLCAGLGVGGEWGIGHAVVAENWQGRQRDRVHGLLQAASPLAMMLAAATGLLLAPAVGWRVVFLAAALPALLAFYARRAMPGADVPPAAVGRSSVRARDLLAPAYRRSTVVITAILVLHMAGFWCVYAELPLALMQRLSVLAHEAAWFQIVVNAVHIVADVWFGYLAARHGRRSVFVAFCLFFCLSQLLVAWFFPWLSADFLWFTAAAALMGLGAGTWSCFGALFGELYPVLLRATAAAVLYNLSRGAQLFTKPMVQSLFDAYESFTPALYLGAVCALGSAVLMRWLPRTPCPAG